MPQVGMECRLLHAAWRGTNNTTAVRGTVKLAEAVQQALQVLDDACVARASCSLLPYCNAFAWGQNPLVILVDEMVMHLMTLHRANLRNNCLHVFSVSGDTSSHCVRKHWVRPLLFTCHVFLLPPLDGFFTSGTVSS